MTVRLIVREPGGQCAALEARGDTDLLDQLEEACPFEVPYLCCVGACGACAAKVVSGADCLDPEGFGIGCSEAAGDQRTLLCVTGARRWAIVDSSQHEVVLELGEGS